jgi:hypothetical protein
MVVEHYRAGYSYSHLERLLESPLRVKATELSNGGPSTGLQRLVPLEPASAGAVI